MICNCSFNVHLFSRFSSPLNGCGVSVVWLWYGCELVVLVWCGCGAVVVRAGLGEGCHLWATVGLDLDIGFTTCVQLCLLLLLQDLWCMPAISSSDTGTCGTV